MDLALVSLIVLVVPAAPTAAPLITVSMAQNPFFLKICSEGLPRPCPVGLISPAGMPNQVAPGPCPQSANNSLDLSAERRLLVRIIIIERTMYADRGFIRLFVRSLQTVFLVLVRIAADCIRPGVCMRL